MHPLHSQAWLDAAIASGFPEYEIQRRCTGRSTAQAFLVLFRAIQSPNREIKVHDHHGTDLATRHLLEMIQQMVEKLELKHIHINKVQHTVIFQNREET
jgi:hypothetical protein